jgi:tetratricopeptide (TPR) repeat protein
MPRLSHALTVPYFPSLSRTTPDKCQIDADSIHPSPLSLSDLDSLLPPLTYLKTPQNRATEKCCFDCSMSGKPQAIGSHNPPDSYDALENARQALRICRKGHPYQTFCINNLAAALLGRFDRLGDLDSLAEATELYHEVLDAHPQGHPDRSASLINLAVVLEARFEQFGDLNSLTEAIELHRQALFLCPPGYRLRSASLMNLADALECRFDQLGDIDSLVEAVELHRQALDLRPQGHSLRSASLSSLAIALHTQFQELGGLDSLAEAVELHRQALDLCQQGHPDRANHLNNLASALKTQFGQLGNLDTLADVVELCRQALDLRPQGHFYRPKSLTNLANASQTRFEQLGDLESLADAIDLHRQALVLRPRTHSDHSSKSLNNLANALKTRFEKLGNLDSLEEAVELHRQALDLRPHGHPDRSSSLNNLSNTLKTRFEQLGDRDSLKEAVELSRQALDLRSQGYPDRSNSLMVLASVLRTHFQRMADINHGPGVHLSNQSRVAVLDEELELYKEGLRLCADGHPLRILFLFALGKCLLRTGTHVFDFSKGIRHILEALQVEGSPPRQSLEGALDALRIIEPASQFFTEHLVESQLEEHDHEDLVLRVYVLLIRLLPRVASFGLDQAGRLRELSGTETVSRDAATRAIAAGRHTEAVEMLEEGRGVFWSQALWLRATNMDILPDSDAQELRRLFQLLEVGSVGDDATSTAARERRVEQRRRLSNTPEALIADIRSRPGMSRFLLPPAFASLVQSLPEKGFVVMLVASNLGHRALVLDRAQNQATSLQLFPPTGGFFTDTVQVSLPRGSDSRVHSTDNTSVSTLPTDLQL